MNEALDERGLPPGQACRADLETTPREVHRALIGLTGGPAILLIDVRTAEEYAAAHVPGSVLIPLHELEARADEIDADWHAPIAVLCHHGARSLRGALLLRAMGFSAARSVVGGIDLWARDVDPAVPRYEMSGGRCVRIAPV